jgi:hypothetical protein
MAQDNFLKGLKKKLWTLGKLNWRNLDLLGHDVTLFLFISGPGCATNYHMDQSPCFSLAITRYKKYLTVCKNPAYRSPWEETH